MRRHHGLALPLLLGLGAFLSTGSAARAWYSTGHRVVAEIAWESLSPAVRAKAVALLAAAPADSGLPAMRPGWGPEAYRDRELFLRAATWPDVVKDDKEPARKAKYSHSAWHFINDFWDQQGPGGTPRERDDLPRPAENVVERLAKLERALGDPALPAAERALALAWVLHLVGDIHQPLHAADRVTASEPKGDQGGNLFLLRRKTNLHRYWDGILSQVEGGSTAERAAQLAARFPRSAFPDLAPSQFASWARASHETAVRLAYPPTLLRDRNPSPAYRDLTYATASRAIALAGYRLAELLERAFATTP